MMRLPTLPIDSFIENILSILQKNQSLVIQAEPGAGKTTRLPPELLKITDKKVLVLEPRRIAALAAASRIAEERKWELGTEVGFQVRFENRTNNNTRLVFITEALLTKKMLRNAELKDIGIIVLDEFHERSLHVDLAIGLLKELQALSRTDLKIVVMSATIDTDKISKYLDNCPIIKVPGKSFELEIFYQREPQQLNTNRDFTLRVIDQIKEVLKYNSSKKDILVFLPGLGEIERVARSLESILTPFNIEIVKLHGSLELAEQKKVLKASVNRKVILSTNVAESALTIDGIDTVIDSGLARISRINKNTGTSTLELSRISKSSATQRAGRAARQFNGVCFRMWNKQDELSFKESEVAEIFRSDLSETLLYLATMGIRDFSMFSWYERPEHFDLNKSILELLELKAIDRSNQITETGSRLAELPLAPRIGKLLLVADEVNCGSLGADICAILQERDALRDISQIPEYECDLFYRLEALFEFRKKNHSAGFSSSALKQIDRASEQLKKYIKLNKYYSLAEAKQNLGPLLLKAFSYALAKRRRVNEPFAVLRNGRGVKLVETSTVKKSEFFIALSLFDQPNQPDTQVSLASGMSKSEIEKHLTEHISLKEEVYFDKNENKLFKKTFRAIDSMPLENPRLSTPTADEAAEHLPEIAWSRWEEIKENNTSLSSYLFRVQFYEKTYSDIVLNDELLKMALVKACYRETKIESLYSKDFVEFIEQEITYNQKNKINNKMPKQITLPSGRNVNIQYFLSKPPQIEARLQEFFGWKESPTIADGKIKLVISLLGPNYRPVQITQDLSGFWKGSYAEVRKELRARYPKHSWPEDPLSAEAISMSKKR